MVYIGDCLRKLNDEVKVIEWYHKAFQEESGRREPLVKLAELYWAKKDLQRTICYCKAALEIPWNGYYSNNKYHYGYIPHEMLAEAYWCAGDKEQARQNIEIALGYAPTHGKLLFDYRFHYDLPKISIIIPTLKRPEGLERCLKSIKALNYPQNLIEIIVLEDEPRIGVPKRVKEGFEKSTGKYVVYASNDCEFTPESIIIAYREMKSESGPVLLAFNTGTVYPDKGNICEHFMIRRDFVEDYLKGEIFDTRYRHLGVDNLLWHKVSKLGRAMRSKNSVVNHYHFTKGAPMDEVYKLAWNKEDAEYDRALLKKDLEELYAK
jgi:tetratricopeptide (TPR) repeat protein